MVKRERKIDVIDLPVVKRTIKKYDNFETTRKKAVKNNRKAISSFRLYIKVMTYGAIFIGVSIFKMNAIYEITDLNMKLQKLNSKITESQLIIENLNYSFDTKENLKEVENLSKQLGFVEDREVKYVRFN
ncbi:MAG: hypothetical protein KBF12_08400 [Sebaldella sp.]|nr:hypothetical protein [Sebaldella sp.]